MDTLLERLRQDLAALGEEQNREKTARFFKEPILCYGVSNASMKQLMRKYAPEVKALSKAEAYRTFEAMLASDYCEEAFLVAEWLPRRKYEFAWEDLGIFRGWIGRYLNNWAKVDTFCNHTLGDFVEKFPEAVDEVLTWTRSDNRWMQRAAAVALIIPAKHGEYLEEAFQIADALLKSPDDLVQKGYGWLLKEASRQHQQEVFHFVVARRAVMPRTALRYAIELMPKELKAEAMRK